MTQLRIYRVYNGVMQFGMVHRIVVAESPEKAINLTILAGMLQTDQMEARDIFQGMTIRVGLCETEDTD